MYIFLYMYIFLSLSLSLSIFLQGQEKTDLPIQEDREFVLP